jgi:glycosyltransferase involved in cell wall biosynthesis
MASALSNLGHTVHVITSTKENGKTIDDNGVMVHKVKNRRMITEELGRLCYSYSVAKRILHIGCRFDIVQSAEFGNEAFWFAQTKKFPLVTRLATPFYLAEQLDSAAFRGLRRPCFFLDWMEKKQTLMSDGIFTSTRALAEKVSKGWTIDTGRVDVIPNSIDLARITRLAKAKEPPEMLGHKELLLYFGRLEERKGVRVLAKALPKVLGRFPQLIMVFIGSDFGYRGSSMKKYIIECSHKYKSQVIFFDNLQHEDLFPIVNSAKIVVLPSLWEAFGFVCLEAMALGRPVIATSGSGFEEIIENNVSGYLVEPGDSDLLAQKIITALTNEQDLRRISVEAAKRARDFEASKVALNLLAYYKRVLGKLPNGS